MEKNFRDIANADKIKHNVQTTLKNPNKYVKEELIPENDAATEIGDKSFLNGKKNTIKLEKKKRYISGTGVTYGSTKKMSENNFMNQKDTLDYTNEESESESESEFSDEDILQDPHEDKRKAELKDTIRRLGKQTGRSYNNKNFKNKSSSELERLISEGKNDIKKRRIASFMWQFIYMLCVVVEKVINGIGYEFRFSGWADEIKENKEEFVGYIDEMIRDTVYIDPKTGEKIIIKNDSFIANLNIGPGLLLLGSLFMHAFQHVGFSNVYKASNIIRSQSKTNTNSKEANEKELFMNMNIPDIKTNPKKNKKFSMKYD